MDYHLFHLPDEALSNQVDKFVLVVINDYHHIYDFEINLLYSARSTKIKLPIKEFYYY